MTPSRRRPSVRRSEDRTGPGGGGGGGWRSSVACTRCRRRKTRCAGEPPRPCVSCADVGANCVYAEAEKRVTVSESYLRRLQSRSQPDSTGPGQQQSQAGSSRDEPARSLPSSTPDILPDQEHEQGHERDDWWYEGTNNLILDDRRSGEHHFVGASSATHLAKRLNPTSTNFAWDVRPLYEDPSSLRRPVNPALPRLPPYDFAKRLFWVQYVYIGTIFSLIQPGDFIRRLDMVYTAAPTADLDREECLIYSQVLLVISFGLMYSVNQWSGDEGPPGFKYFQHALRFLPDIHEEGSIFFVEVLCYVAYYMQNLNRRDAAFIYIGLALRMAISLGLHQEVSDPEISEEYRDRRRRAWWSVYSLDRLLSVKSGNPITIQDEDIGTGWPIHDDASIPAPWPSVVLTHYTKLSRILGRIGEEIYRKKPRSRTNLLTSVQSITNSLSSWLAQVPDGLRIDFTSLDNGGQINRESVSTFLHFYSCVNMTSRPLVFYVIQRRLDAEAEGRGAGGDWKEGLSGNTVAMIDSCITAARATTVMMDAAAKHDLVATYGYLDGEYVFSAALLLVMVNAAFPYNETNARSMETALGLLRGMADRGNTYLGSRHSLLLELQAALNKPSVSTNVRTPGTTTTGTDADTATGPVAPGAGASAGDPNTQPQPQTQTEPITSPLDSTWSIPPAPMMPVDWPLQEDLNLPAAPNISFDMNVNDDPAGLWEGVMNQIDIDMDPHWIESALRR